MSVRQGTSIIAGNPVFRSQRYTVDVLDWDQDTLSVELTFAGLTAASEVIVSPAGTTAENIKAYSNSCVFGSALSTDTITLKCSSIPSVTLTIDVGMMR